MGDEKIVRRIFELRTFKKRKKGQPTRNLSGEIIAALDKNVVYFVQREIERF
jgi:hypothetical protein